MLLPLMSAWAQEHAPPALAPVAPVVTALIPDGPARTVEVRPGEDLQAVVRTLPTGSRIRLGAGRHPGPLVLDRPLDVGGEPGAAIVGGGRGTVVTILADDVLLHDVEISGSGGDPTHGDAGVLVAADRVRIERIAVREALIGVDFRQADDGVLLDSEIHGWEARPLGQRGDGVRLWESNGNRVEGNRLSRVRDLVVWYSSHNVVRGNEVRESRYGTHFMHADDNDVVGNRFVGDVVGVFVMYSRGIRLHDNLVSGADGAAGMGFGFKESDACEALRNRLIGNTTGLYLDQTPHRVDGLAVFSDNLLAYNHVGLRIHGRQAGARLEGNDFHENATQVAVDGNADATHNTFSGNRWSDYAGYDLDHDGVGDVPYTLRTVSGGLAERKPAIQYFSGTLAAGLLDLLAAVFPMFAPRPVLTDPSPEMG